MVISHPFKPFASETTRGLPQGFGRIASGIDWYINQSLKPLPWGIRKSMRGKSELLKADGANQTSSGLDRDYIYEWSYGIDETMSLLVPDAGVVRVFH